MKRSKSTALCCGAGGAQMFKEPEKGNMDINELRTQDALETNPDIIATGCPYCMTMMSDGVKIKEKENDIKVLDIAELIANAQDL
jgi:Fe-S oxidoreductase